MTKERNLAAAIIAFAGLLMAGIWIPRMQALADASGAGCRVTAPPASVRTAVPNAAIRTYSRALHVTAHIPESAVVPGEDPTPSWRIVPDEDEMRCVIATPSPTPHADTRYTLLTGELIATELALDSGGNRILLIAKGDDDDGWQSESFLPASVGPLWRPLTTVGFGFGIVMMGIGLIINFIWGPERRPRRAGNAEGR